ncbi:type II toxin-antitoxin system VapC family toxin [soil metagenome]
MTNPVYMLDSNICIYILDGQGSLLRNRIECHSQGEIVVSSISYAEVMRGIPVLDAGRVRNAERFFDFFAVQDFDRGSGRAYREIPFRRGSFDRLIAAHALTLGLTLVTNNEADFADVPGLKVENWTI